MGKFHLLLCFLTLSLSSSGQSNKEYFFKEIRLHIKSPNNYLFKETFPKTTSGSSKELLNVSTSDSNNSVSFKIAKQTRQTFNFEQCYNAFRDEQLIIGKQQMKIYDTLSSTLNVGNVKIRKFFIHSTTVNPHFYSGVYVATVKHHFLIIHIDYIDKNFGDEIEKAIVTSKFD